MSNVHNCQREGEGDSHLGVKSFKLILLGLEISFWSSIGGYFNMTKMEWCKVHKWNYNYDSSILETINYFFDLEIKNRDKKKMKTWRNSIQNRLYSIDYTV